MEQDVVQLVLGELVGVVGVLVDGVPVVAEIFQGQLEALIAKGLDEVIGDPQADEGFDGGGIVGGEFPSLFY